MNDGGEFERSYKEIYPPELELKTENSGDAADFLDLHITLNDNTFSLSLFDKRDGFPFSIVRMPFRTSNIPTKIFYSAIGAEVLRIGRTTSREQSFLASAKSLIQRMFQQGASKSRLVSTLKKDLR